MLRYMRMDKDLVIGERVKKLRKRNDFTQEEFAEELGISRMTVSRIENGTTSLNMKILSKMSQVLQVSENEILNSNK